MNKTNKALTIKDIETMLNNNDGYNPAMVQAMRNAIVYAVDNGSRGGFDNRG